MVTLRGVHLHIKEVKNPWVVERKYALKDKNVRRVDRSGSLQPSMFLKGVYGNLGTFSTADGLISYR